MMTRTSAQDYSKYNIYMNSIDTGWINDENPYEKARDLYKNHNFQTPIDEIDAAARIIDPIMSSIHYKKATTTTTTSSSTRTNENNNNKKKNDGDTSTATGYMKPIYGKFLKDYRETEW